MRTTLVLQAVAAACLVPAATLRAQEASMTFDTTQIVGDPTASFVEIGDLDGDGLPDLVSGRTFSGSSYFSGYLNRGAAGWLKTGEYVQSAGSAPSGFPTTFHTGAGELSGDGGTDLVFGQNLVLRGLLFDSAPAAPTVAWTVNETASIQGVECADFDGDGLADIAVVTPSEIKIYTSVLGGPPVVSSVLATSSAYTRWSAQLIELDGVPPIDLAFYGRNPGSSSSALYLFTVSSTATLSAPTIVGISGVTDGVFSAGDVDGDADVDFVFSSSAGARVLRNLGASSYSLEPPQTFVGFSQLLDADGDGDLDGWVVNNGGGVSNAMVAVNDGTGSFSPHETWFNSVGGGSTALAADLDADSDVDFVFGRAIVWGGSTIKDVRHGAQLNFGELIGDADGDGDADMNFRNGISSITTVNLYRNDGTGKFVVDPIGTLNGGAPEGGFSVDFDGDGLRDILVGNLALRNLGGSVFQNVGAATSEFSITSPFSIPVPIHDYNRLAGDLDGDGDEDLIVRIRDAISPSLVGFRLWWNLGGGQFQGGAVYTDRFPYAIVDLDGDGLSEIVLYRHLNGNMFTGYGELRVWKNLGSGSFATDDLPTAWAPVEFPALIHVPPGIGDVNDDGLPDILSFAALLARLQLNDGAGGFYMTASYPEAAPLFAGSLILGGGGFIADADGDGLDDLVLRMNLDYNGAVSVRRRTGPATFAPGPIEWTEFSGLADADGDGDLDAFELFKLRRNRSHHGAAAGSRRQYGPQSAGPPPFSTYSRPRTGATGPFRPGETTRILVNGGVGGATGYLVVGGAETNTTYSGLPLLVDPLFLLPITLDGAVGATAEGGYTLDFAAPSWFAGVPIYLQTWLMDAASPPAFYSSNGLELIFGS